MSNENEKVVEEKEELRASTGMKLLCFLIPFAGLIIYLSEVSTNRKYAIDCGRMALISTIIAVALPILIIGSLFLLGAGIATYNLNTKIETVPTSNLTSMEISSFNSKFLAYEGENVSGSTVRSLITIIGLETTNDIDIVINNKTYYDTTKARTEIKSYSKYRVRCNYNTKGLVDEVVITEKNSFNTNI